MLENVNRNEERKVQMNAEVIEKLRKVLALANGRGATQGEIESALARAKEIAVRHNIDLASVNVDRGEEKGIRVEVEKDSSLKTRSKFEQPYHSQIYKVVQLLFDVRIIRGLDHTYNGPVVRCLHLFGDPFDVALVKEIFPWLEKVFPKILSTFVREGALTYSAADTNGCYKGVAAGILEANRREEEKIPSQDKNGWALVVRGKREAINKLVDKTFPDLQTPRHTSKSLNAKAFNLGHREGSKINLRQVEGKNTMQSIR